MPKDQQPNWPANIAKINIAWSLAIIAIVAGVAYRNYLKTKHPEAFAKNDSRNCQCENCDCGCQKCSRKSVDGILRSSEKSKTAETEEN